MVGVSIASMICAYGVTYLDLHKCIGEVHFVQNKRQYSENRHVAQFSGREILISATLKKRKKKVPTRDLPQFLKPYQIDLRASPLASIRLGPC